MSRTSACTLARSPEELDAVYRLRYDCYRRTDAIPANADHRFRDVFDASPNHFSFLVHDAAGDPAATLRVSVLRPDLGWADSPASRVYADHPCLKAFARQSFVEASRLCFAHQAGPHTFVRLVAHLAALADFYNVPWLVACPRVEHAHTYERLFGFQAMAAPRRYFGVAFDTVLLAVQTEAIRGHAASHHLMTAAWSEALDRLMFALPRPEFPHSDGISISASSGKWSDASRTPGASRITSHRRTAFDADAGTNT